MRAHAVLMLGRCFTWYVGEKKKDFNILFNFENVKEDRLKCFLPDGSRILLKGNWKKIGRAHSQTSETLGDHRLPTVPSQSQSPFQFPGIKYLWTWNLASPAGRQKLMKNFIFQKEDLVILSLTVCFGIGANFRRYLKLYVFLKLVYQKNFSIMQLNMC